MAIPTWVSGQVLTASDVNNWFVPQVAYVTADETPNVTTTLTNDSVLFLPVVANAVYTMFLWLQYTGSATGGYKFGFTAPSGATLLWNGQYITAGGGSFVAGNTLATVQGGTVGSLGARYEARWEGLLTTGSGAGNFQLQYAENALDATHGSYTKIGSFMTLQRVG